ncbi:hypothetical protein GHX08_23055 [Salmonella enterica]|nr:hypothetical protein [Salmonella enterica]
MTTNNHPANGPVSLDRLHQISEILSKAAQSDGGNLGYAMADAVKVIAGVIAAFDAEPDEFLPDNLDRALTILGVALPISKEEFNLDAEHWMQRLINRVIRLESELIPPAPVVPEEKRDEDGNTTSEFDHGWNSCRAAMLQAGNFREISNSSTNNCREISETSTNCPKCAGHGTYHCLQMLGTVECECILPVPKQEKNKNV